MCIYLYFSFISDTIITQFNCEDAVLSTSLNEEFKKMLTRGITSNVPLVVATGAGGSSSGNNNSSAVTATAKSVEL